MKEINELACNQVDCIHKMKGKDAIDICRDCLANNYDRHEVGGEEDR